MDRRKSLSVGSGEALLRAKLESASFLRKRSNSITVVADDQDSALHRGTIPDETILVYAPRTSRLSISHPHFAKVAEKEEAINVVQARKILAAYGESIRKKPRATRSKIPDEVNYVAKYISELETKKIYLLPQSFSKAGGQFIRPISALPMRTKSANASKLRRPKRAQSAPSQTSNWWNSQSPAEKKPQATGMARIDELARPRLKNEQFNTVRIKASTVRAWTASNRIVQRLRLSNYVHIDAQAYHDYKQKQAKHDGLLKRGLQQLEEERVLIQEKIDDLCSEWDELLKIEKSKDYERRRMSQMLLKPFPVATSQMPPIKSF